MSKKADELPERLRSVGARGLEQRLLRAASHERPTRELSERMARGLGVTLPAVGAGAAAGLATETAAAAAKTAVTSSSVVPWLSGTLAAALVVGGLVALRPSTPTPTPTRPSLGASASQASLGASASQASLAPTAVVAPRVEAPAKPSDETSPRPAVVASAQRARGTTTANELASQIALVDAARTALASGRADSALSGVREYQAKYPSGAFRPEAAAVKIEALLKLGRKAEARALAERFVSGYGPGPLADRVTRLVGIPQP
jgi:TolA-binding protein